MSGSRVDRRIGFVVAVFSGLVVVGCSASTEQTTTTATTPSPEPGTTAEPPPSTEAAAESRRGGEAVAAIPLIRALSTSMNPFLDEGYYTPHPFIHAGTVDIGEDGEAVPIVFSRVPSVDNGLVVVNPDGTVTVRYEIRDEAVWADGTPISGDDIAFTLETLGQHVEDLTGRGFDFRFEQLFGEIISTEAEPKAFIVMLEDTRVDYAFGLSLIPKHVVEGRDFLNDFNDVPWVSGGPYLLESFDREAPSYRFVRNNAYWLRDPETDELLPHLDALEQRFYACDGIEDDEVVAAVREGSVHWTLGGCFDQGLMADAAADIDGAGVALFGKGIMEHLVFGFGEGRLGRNPSSLTDQVAFRRAIAHAIDRQSMFEEVYEQAPIGSVGVLDSYVAVASPALSTDAWAVYDYDPERAMELITGACLEAGRDCDSDPPTLAFSTTASRPFRVKLTEVLVEDLEAVGIEVVADLEPDDEFFFGGTLPEGDFELVEFGYPIDPGIAGLISQHDFWHPDLPSPDGPNVTRWGEALPRSPAQQRLADVIDEMQAGGQGAVALIQEAEQILADEVLFIPLWERPDFVLRLDCFVDGLTTSRNTFGLPFEFWYLTEECR